MKLMLPFPVCDDVFPVMSERGDGEAVRVSGQKRHKLPDPSAAAPRPGRLLLTSESHLMPRYSQEIIRIT